MVMVVSVIMPHNAGRYPAASTMRRELQCVPHPSDGDQERWSALPENGVGRERLSQAVVQRRKAGSMSHQSRLGPAVNPVTVVFETMWTTMLQRVTQVVPSIVSMNG